MGFETLSGKLDVALNVLCSCVVFLFIVTSAPVSQFRGKGLTVGTDGVVSGASKLACVTVWGLKNDCSKMNYEHRPVDMTCNQASALFKVSEAFYIIAALTTCGASLLGGLYFLGIKTKIALYVLTVLNIVFILIPWACMTGVWYQNYCGGSTVPISTETGSVGGIPYGKQLRDNFKTSAAYGLTVSAWCIQIIGLILLCVM
ncbi:putative Surface protein amastin [Leptomonas pyrrhocoris]|uniref:Putative Surface protein amastin n=1 Tax=Leptomonas pyrrhocoris TaxID=157538 RepID=A0A0M9G686_LEPPY|nr:putative Surface protein amastin [Leptomonas pyrrhocoris]XP_015661529.1 putative Surface protein amastin [Leptomonas pyrrhocoris]KPA83089.1 putative Surface protein amastin [Leptomonas pyrrhocoris]KPA83090.1 putative Surface protein amastin [Leptomonas pyrrhocoris]|eukprot:XP_015661528.1 putative Surface protein amastin [Leptomonas pyrrhocoris]